MTTSTIILITWFLAGLLTNVLIIYNNKKDIIINDLKAIIFVLLLGYILLFFTLIILSLDYIKLPKIKLPKGDTVIWKYPKKK